MGLAISALPPVTIINDDDVFEIVQSGASKCITSLEMEERFLHEQLAVDVTTLPQNGDVVSFDGTDYVPGAAPRWRVVPVEAYTEAAPTTYSTITFAGGGPTDGINLKASDYFSVGLPVRVGGAGTLTYYGICTAVTTTLLTISGAALPTWTSITSLSVGTPDMVRHVRMCSAGTGYPAVYPLQVTKGCTHVWRGATGYLCAYSVAHMNTSSTTEVQLRLKSSGGSVSNPGVKPAAGTASTYGAFVDSALGSLQQSLVEILDGGIIRVVTIVGGSADYLILCMTFVVP